MKFAGIVKTSTVDYPGKIVSTVFTAGCKFECEYCHNFHLMNPMSNEVYIDEKEVLDHLKKRGKLIDGLCITGGEPSLWKKEVIEFIKRVKKEVREDIVIKVDTNGSDPEFIKSLSRFADYVAMDFKSLDYTIFSKVTNETILISLEELKKIKNHEVRITMYPPYIKEEDFNNIADILRGVKKVSIQQFKPQIVYIDKNVEPYEKEVLIKFKEILECEGIAVEIRK
jgi:pyruvate formate lyase activating enzyme